MEGFEQYTQAERVARLEVKIIDVKHEIAKIDDKLDQIIALRNRGAGVLWFLTALGGTGIVAFIATILDWIRLRH